MSINEKIVWRRGHTDALREPQIIDVEDGRAEIVFAGEHRMSEGAKIEVVGGRLLFSSGPLRPDPSR